MRHILCWHQLSPTDQATVADAETALRAAPTVGIHAAAATHLAQTPGVLVATAADLRVIRAAMDWIGMGTSTPATDAGTGAATAAWAYPHAPEAFTGPQPARGASGRHADDDRAADARPPAGGDHPDAGHRRRGLPLRTLTIPGLTWDVTAGDCRYALRTWRGVLHDWHPHEQAVFDVCGLTTGRRRHVWLTWLAFLTGAADHDGFHAEGAAHPINRTTFTGREPQTGHRD